tara:strand:- start:1324 stop:2043 length:720 start_codon:yes stop_codon:yes gene_type:complete
MAEAMTLESLQAQEFHNTGTSWTKNEQFEKDGYLVVKDLWDVEELLRPVPEERGQINYWGTKPDQFNFTPLEGQVEGSLAVYTHPQYKYIHTGIRLKLEEIIGRKLYNTYYYDRFYFAGQELTIHADRDACEISVSVHISTNLDECWPLWIKTPDTYNEDKSEVLKSGEKRSVCLNPGDGMIYKGCERPHWREPLVSRHTGNHFIRKLNQEDDTFYHQVFFHYVLADGKRSHCAYDMAR